MCFCMAESGITNSAAHFRVGLRIVGQIQLHLHSIKALWMPFHFSHVMNIVHCKKNFSYCNIIFVSAAFSTSQWNRQVVRDIFQEVPLIWRPCTHTAATKHFSIMQSLVSDIASPFICCHALSFECQEGAASTKVELRDSGKTRAKVVPMFTSTNVVWLLTSFCRKYRGIRTLCAHCISSDVTE